MNSNEPDAPSQAALPGPAAAAAVAPAPTPTAPAPTEAAPAAPAQCKNCHAVLLGRFCVNCSQAADVHVPSTLELLHEMLEGLTHSDSRLWRTLKFLWFKPGKLTEEFVSGRRVAYLPPIRLYLILSIVFFLIASFMHTSGQVLQFDDALKPAGAASAARVTRCQDINFITFTRHPEWNQRIQHACLEIVRDNGENLLHVAVGTMSKAMFIFLPLIAFLHMLLYWRPRYRYAEHLLFFIHLHAFYFSVAIVMICAINAADSWPKLSGVSNVLETLLGWCLPIYTFFAMRRVFRRSWIGTLLKGVVLFFVYSIVFGLTVAGVVVYAVLQL
jgi:hypothetical protein